ncbi:MAG: threonine/serine dehydratase [Wenzhouxiangellaceae bacterium]|nr:threonine/serine dehydratase [Wenzhouxiangellaceae bacterium]
MDIQPHTPSPAEALAAIHERIRRTPVLHCDALDALIGARIAFKAEHLQHTGSFKFRGASFAVSRLPEGTRAVATHSSGNHGAALAAAARDRGMQACVVMPENAVGVKIEAVRANGGEVVFCKPTQAAREAGLAARVADGHVAVPPYDHPDIIAGQGTVALELLAQVPDLDVIIAPIGGGGLLAGITRAVAEHTPQVEVIGAEPAAADDAWRSLRDGKRVESHQPDTIADGLRALIGVRNFEILAAGKIEILTADESEIIESMLLLWRHLKATVEPSAALPLAVMRAQPERFAGRRVGVVLSGGNVDLDPVRVAFNPGAGL